MFNFFKKKEVIDSNEYKKLKKELLDIDTKVLDLESSLFKVLQDVKNIKGKVNSRIYKQIQDDGMEGEGTKDINNSVLLPDNGSVRKSIF